MLVAYVKKNYERAFSEMDLVIANSQNVRNRIQKYLNADAIVINPPVDTSAFKCLGQQNYNLPTARLEKYKRVDLIVSAFKKMPDKKLIVTSGGSELENLRKMAGNAPNITFTGWIDHEELVRLMGNAIATIYMLKDEDFGMSPVESMAAGKQPVIGVNEGGIRETVVDGVTGMLVGPDIGKIVRAVDELNPKIAERMKKDSVKRAQLLSSEIFIYKIINYIC